MHARASTQKGKAGQVWKYLQIVRSYRRPKDGMPAVKIIGHLGTYDALLHQNLNYAFAATRKGINLVDVGQGDVRVSCQENLAYLPVAVVAEFLREFGVSATLRELTEGMERNAPLDVVMEALVAHRCTEPGSKLAFQRWLGRSAVPEVVGVSAHWLNNTRVHRAMREMAQVEDRFQDWLSAKIVGCEVPRVLYLDLTDTWFESGGGELAQRAQTKQGHRSKRKIHIAMLVNEQGLPMRWELLPGALNETTVLPEWLELLAKNKSLDASVLIFDRGMPSAKNLLKLVDRESGHLFLTSVKSDAIPTYVKLPSKPFDSLQSLVSA